MSEPGRELTTLMNAAELVMNGLDGAMAERVAKQWEAKCAEAVQARAGWQPIETVPKVGTFLVYLPEEFLRPFQVMYRTERTTIIGGAFAFDMSKPTHWMPLPAPPVESKSEVVG